MWQKQINTVKDLSYRIGQLSLIALVLFSGAVFAKTNEGETGNAAAKAARVKEAEELLSNLGYWITSVDVKTDDSTRQGIIAFQKVEGMKRTGVLDDQTLRAIRLASTPTAKYQGAAHVEIDITRQVIFLVNDEGQVTKVLSTSRPSRYSVR